MPLQLRGEKAAEERNDGGCEGVGRQRPAACVVVGEDAVQRALQEAAVERSLRFRRLDAVAAPDLEEHQRRRAPDREQTPGGLGVDHVVERLSPQLRRRTQPFGLPRQRLEEQGDAFRAGAVAQLRQLPAGNVDQRSADGPGALVQGRALLVETARRPQRQADVGGRIDEQRQRPRSLRRRRLGVDAQCGRRGRSDLREHVARVGPGGAGRELRIGHRRPRQARQVGATQPIGGHADVAHRRGRHGAAACFLGRHQRRLRELRQIGDRDGVGALLDCGPAVQAEGIDGLVHGRVPSDGQRRQRLRRFRFRLREDEALLRAGLVREEAIEIALSEHGLRFAGQGVGELRAGTLERVDLRSGLPRDGQRGELLRQEAKGARVAW